MKEAGGEMSTRKERILDAALKAYMEYGIESATTRQIADIAGIGKSTIYEYFKSSEELLDEAFSYYINAVNRGWKDIRRISEDDPQRALALYIDSTVELIINEPDKLLLISQYIVSILSKHRDFQEVRREYGEKIYPMTSFLLEEYKHIITMGIEKGVFGPVQGMGIDETALMLMALIREMQSQVFIQGEKQIREMCRCIKDMIFHMLGVR